MTKKHYQLTIIDDDGDEHHYYFLASNPWIVNQHVVSMMLIDDFYGHTAEHTIEIHVAQLMDMPNSNLIPIELV